MSVETDLLGGFELHAPDTIRAALANGVDPTVPIRGKPALRWLVEMYTRSRRFAQCVHILIGAGATLDDPLLEAILLDDVARVRSILSSSPRELGRTVSMGCAYTSMHDVSWLHVCAEYNCTECARALLDAGMDVDVRAGIDAKRFGGQSPLFHTVNSNRNYCRPMMELLVESGADVDVRLRGVTWGVGCDWETAVFDVTPISYAQCGLYPQFHRIEHDVYANIDYLFRHRYGCSACAVNVPNKYVDHEFDLGAARGGQRAEPPSQSA